MDDPTIIAGAFVIVIAAIGTTIVQIVNAVAAANDRREARSARLKLEAMAEINAVKTDKIVEQGVAIHTLTNSNLSKVTADLATAVSKIEGLEKVIVAQTKAKEIADALATKNVQK